MQTVAKDDLSLLIEEIIKFRDDRDWHQFHDPKNLSEAISIEAAELQEIFLWKSTEESKKLSADKLQKVKNELVKAKSQICMKNTRESSRS